MCGKECSAELLNRTLIRIVQLLNEHEIEDWFVCYGTLLGLVREDSCIEGDDDIDIIVHKDAFDQIQKILTENEFRLCYEYFIEDSRDIIKTYESEEYASVDIYMADFNEDDVFDKWNGLRITDCYLDKDTKSFVEKQWNGQRLYFPNNYVRILKNRYGDTWNIKQNQKVDQTMCSL